MSAFLPHRYPYDPWDSLCSQLKSKMPASFRTLLLGLCLLVRPAAAVECDVSDICSGQNRWYVAAPDLSSCAHAALVLVPTKCGSDQPPARAQRHRFNYM